MRRLAAIAALALVVVAVACQPTPPTVTITPVDGGGINYYAKWSATDGTVLRDPQKFPVTVFNSNALRGQPAAYAALGINGYTNLFDTSQTAWAEIVAQHQFTILNPPGGPTASLPQPPASVTQVGYVWGDEPDGTNICGNAPAWTSAGCVGDGHGRTSPESVNAIDKAISLNDPTRFIFDQFTKPVAINSGIDDATATRYIAYSDVISYDWYPIEDGFSPANWWDQCGATRHVRALAGNAKPVWVFIALSRAFNGTDGRRAPTPAEIRNEMWTDAVCGARGIELFKNDFSVNGPSGDVLLDSRYKPVQDIVRQTTGELQSVAPGLNSPFADGYATVDCNCNWSVHRSGTADAGNFWIMITPKQDAPQPVHIHVPGDVHGIEDKLYHHPIAPTNDINATLDGPLVYVIG